MIREVRNCEIKNLSNTLKQKGHLSLAIVALLDINEEFGFSRKIFVSESDSRTFIFISDIVSTIPSFSIYWDSQILTDDELVLYLKSIPNWNWNKKFLFCALDKQLANKLDAILTEEDMFPPKLEKESNWLDFLTFEIVPQNLEEITLPKVYIIRNLKPKNAEYILSKWPYNINGDVSKYTKYLKIFPSSAVFKEDDEDGQPISWVILYNHGFIGMMYTDPEYRKLGFCRAVLYNLCNKLKDKNLRLLTQVEANNSVSLKFHKKIGANFIHNESWNRYAPCFI